MKKKLIITTIFVSIFIAAIDVHETYASQYTDCIDAAGDYATIESIKQACSDYNGHGTNSSWGAVWYSSTENGQEDIKITSLDSNSQTIYLSGAVYNGSNASKERYYEGSGDANYKGLFWGEIEDSTCKLVNKDGTNFDIDCDSLILSGSFNHTDIYRGRLTGKNQWSVVGGEEGEAKPIELNLAAIKTLILNKGWAASELSRLEITNSRSIWWAIGENDDGSIFYTEGGNLITTSSSPIYFDISDTFSVSSKVRGKKSTETNYTSWSNQYIDSISNGDPTKEDAWNIEFKHILTINGEDREIKQTSDCPSGYSCTFSGSPSLTPSLTSAGKRTEQQFLTVKQNSTGTRKSSDAAKYEVSKTTTQTSSDAKTIIYDTICSTTSPNPTIIDYSTTTASATFYASSGSLETNISHYPQELKNYISSNPPTSYYETQTANKALENGQQDTLTYNGFHKKKYTINYTATTTDDGTGPKTTYNITGYSGPENDSVVTCPTITIYREAQAEIQIKNAIKATSETSTIINGNNITEYTSNSNRNVSTQIDINDPNTKIYVGSSDSDSINITTTHYIKRSNGGYDANYSINVPWTTMGDITGTNTSSTSIQYDSEKELNPISKTVSNSEIELGKYDYRVTDTFQSNDRLTIKYGKVTEESGTPISATATAHLYRPWNYNLSFTSIESTSNKGMLYLNNQTTTVTANLENNNNIYSDPAQEGNPSYSPKTTFTLYQVTISDSDLTGVTNISNYIQNLEWDIKNGTRTGISVGSPQTKTFDPESSNNTVEFKNITFYQAGIGDHICLYATANHTNSYDDTTGRPGSDPTYYGTPKTTNILHSGLTCFTVAGFPTFQVRGGSILTEGNAKAKVVESNGEYFGSWIDYGLATKGDIKQLSSGKAFIGTEEYTYPKNHPLTIANNAQNSNEPKGQSNISASATKKRLKSLYAPGAKTALDDDKFTDNSTYDDEIDISQPTSYATYTSNQFTMPTSDTNAKYRYTYINKPDNDTVIKQGSDLPKGVTHVIYSTGNIVIGSDFTYSSSESYNQISDIPQYVIISEKNIYIDQDVKEIHAWLIADGEINTCTGYEKWDYPEDESNALHQQVGGKGYDSATYTKDVCNTALKISGPIFANNIWLERTSISGVTGVSETVNLTAENYYWALAKAKESNKISTAYTRSLAPRY